MIDLNNTNNTAPVIPDKVDAAVVTETPSVAPVAKEEPQITSKERKSIK